MRCKIIQTLIAIALLAGLASQSPLRAEEYPPALNYDDFIEAVKLDTQNAKLYFANKVLSVHVYLPGRNVQVRTDIADNNGTLLLSSEHLHTYKNGAALGEINTWQNACEGGKCISSPNSITLKPGLYWMIFSEKGKIFSAEWFEVRSYKQGEGRFAKGEVFYSYLPQTQMARFHFASDGQLLIDAGFAGEKEVGDQSSITKKMLVTLKHNGKVFAKQPGKEPHNITLYPYTTLETLPISKAANNSIIKKADLKDGNYELEIQLDGKLYRKFIFQWKGGKFVTQGRQKDNMRPTEQMIVSENSSWFWNSLTQEPKRIVPAIDLSKTAEGSH
ncbi:hypothetical protein COW36_13405 [bacterium (Candidatus Blackallbacteria) CG17_big_fil_post_rev_8_21_14_2_50_48_46]|uniref:Uncharacterized protein n=1 Tax=bacterium (Candidatus Blackallbacteria) CG17_big_fil_post_rev_8_21_14_2_50_48_46 TaxID=2014261 RepID=A0A2M7G496_9BACT|nr:MAG: hypothetical protein COW64_22025 [bacterium (Candidatus Blackallbacteria) CG18_big_fil_WC_8_21_14_2_50_49_26]PIW16324.1 MAG: hypothetical protein COW36_13405 [bacterium (Candidatus Blackallbacteria) CG17_big_fil_post_rev_8_21_14_2_50_48_46]PIW45338.1 MAG: hypothetical protein COW20_20640 [bacterium (Candidatus Blackallbacteria) CG13_big_fil_rev_8_21_14_2_50_49_14]